MHAKCFHLCALLAFSVVLVGASSTQAQPATQAQPTTQVQSREHAQAEALATEDRRAVKDAIRSFFDALSSFDFRKVRALAAEDFTAIEDGTVLGLEKFVRAGQKLKKKGATTFQT